MRHIPLSKLEALSRLGPNRKYPGIVPQSVREAAPQLEFTIVSNEREWQLCGSAEPRMRDSFKEKTLINVNGFLLVKFRGRMTALCIKNTVVNGNTFTAGTWYSPVGDELRQKLRDDFDAGTTVVAYETGEWTRMRESYDDSGTLLKEARRYARNMPRVIPEMVATGYTKVTRREYRESLSESGQRDTVE